MVTGKPRAGFAGSAVARREVVGHGPARHLPEGADAQVRDLFRLLETGVKDAVGQLGFRAAVKNIIDDVAARGVVLRALAVEPLGEDLYAVILDHVVHALLQAKRC